MTYILARFEQIGGSIAPSDGINLGIELHMMWQVLVSSVAAAVRAIQRTLSMLSAWSDERWMRSRRLELQGA